MIETIRVKTNPYKCHQTSNFISYQKWSVAIGDPNKFMKFANFKKMASRTIYERVLAIAVWLFGSFSLYRSCIVTRECFLCSW